ncbi:MAG: enoyl-CoA hydratase/isomerase family protein [Deltaproteobacteria bacterium]|nr:enoyl-CoA hydratase/isomerase family protein [Deltaproteobacteria bacterium]
MYHTLHYTLEDHVAAVTLNRPDRRNALGPEMINELLYALENAHADPSVRVVLLQGAGSAFCAGADFSQFTGATTPSTLPMKGDFSDLLQAMVGATKPLVARVQGPALGGGFGLVAACHLAVASETATFGTPEVLRGLWPMMIMAVLARTLPRRALLELMLLGEKVTAEDAKRLGVVNRVVPAEALDATVKHLCGELAKRSPTAVRRGLGALARLGERPLAESLPLLRDELFELLGTDDAREGLQAYMEKREPHWTGH